MRCHKATRQFTACEHHANLFGVGLCREDFGVPREMDAGGLDRFLVNGSGRHGVDLPRQGRFDRRFDVLIRCLARGPIHDARLQFARVDGCNVNNGRHGNLRASRRPLLGVDDRKCRRQVQHLGRSRQHARVAEDNRRAEFAHRSGGQKLQANLGANPGGVTHRDGDAWQCHLGSVRSSRARHFVSS